MSTPKVITNEQLPLNQDYRLLKAEGLAYIQEHSGQEWNNLNNVDPGVTILDQLCYALTELGYCNDFPVEDILTDADGTMELKDQFYLPEEILTTAPVTLTDYRRCLIDGVTGVANVYIVPVRPTLNAQSGAYQVYLMPGAAVQQPADLANLCTAAYVYLNKWRNLGEIFLKPLCLVNDVHTISGRIEIKDERALVDILDALQRQVQNYIFPQVKPTGYDELKTRGRQTDEIFNGPLLQRGWIPAAALGEKKDVLQLLSLQQVLLEVKGISYISDLIFDGQPSVTEIRTTAASLLTIDWQTSFNTGLEFYCKGKKLAVLTNLDSLFLNRSQPSAQSLVFGASVNIHTSVPAGKFRDINTYYSIQNTFPEVFAVGTDAITANATPFQIAQSRQLKGYLTLFDQVLANQFSQLANVGTLFSFKNALSGTPSDLEDFYAVQDVFTKTHPVYPVPYLYFSPTYFYQSLYSVPYIRPLLKNNEVFNFTLTAGTENERAEKSWEAYKKDPYNSYMRGLMEMMENDQTSFSRRNDLLNHLLARHGESPLLIDTILNGSSYAGENLKDQVIFKSLYLQNLGLLSYFRQKAPNFLGANKISGSLTDVPEDFYRKIMGGYTHDFIFKSEKIDAIEELNARDFINFSALELKLSLLFGLRIQYRDFIANHYEDVSFASRLRMAMWMIMERRGVLLIETGLLLADTTIPAKGKQVELIFPAFIPSMNTEVFKARIALFLQETVPVQVSWKVHFVDSNMLEKLILAFSDWHNELIYTAHQETDKRLVYNADVLIKLMNQVNTETHE